MPEYIYRREDGTTFTLKQKFSDDTLTIDPETGQKVFRVVQPTSIIFKGSGFYVNDSRNASKKNLSNNGSSNNGNGKNGSKSEDALAQKKEAKPADTTAEKT